MAVGNVNHSVACETAPSDDVAEAKLTCGHARDTKADFCCAKDNFKANFDVLFLFLRNRRVDLAGLHAV